MRINKKLQIFEEKRLVFGHLDDQPIENVDEFRSLQAIQAVKEEAQDFETVHGLNITTDPGSQPIEHRRLGIRDKMHHSLERLYPGQTSADVILDGRITARLRTSVAKEVAQERLTMKFLKKKASSAWGILSDAVGFLRGENGDYVGSRLTTIYGDEAPIEDRRLKVAQDVVGELDTADLDRMKLYLLGTLKGNQMQRFRTNINESQMQLIQRFASTVPPEKLSQFQKFLSSLTKDQLQQIQRFLGSFDPNQPDLISQLDTDQLQRQLAPATRGQVIEFQQFFTDIDQSIRQLLVEFITNITPDQVQDLQQSIADVNVPLDQLLAQATPAQLEQMRDALPFLPSRRQDPIYPAQEQIPPATPFDRLIQLLRIETQERKKLLSNTVYDAQRLQHFLNNELKRNNWPIYDLLTTRVLDHGALDKLENHPEALALVAYLEFKMSPDSTALETELDTIRNRLPVAPDVEGEEASAESEQVQQMEELANSLAQTHTELLEKYDEMSALKEALSDANDKYSKLPSREEGQSGATTDTGRTALLKEISGYKGEKRSLKTTILKMERGLKNSSTNLLSLLKQVPNVTPPPKFIDRLSEVSSVEPGELKAKMNEFEKDGVMKNLQNEIATNYRPQLQRRHRVSPRQLLYLLKEGDFVNRGITNPEMRRRHALLSTNMMVVDAQNIQINLSVNQELAERYGETLAGSGWLNRVAKWGKVHLTSGEVYTAREIIDSCSGFQRKFAVFHGMSQDVTLAELRDKIHNYGHIDQAGLYEYAEQLKKVLYSFEMLNSEGKVELYDKDAVDLEQLITNLLLIREEIRSREFMDTLTDEDDKDEAMLRRMREEETARKEEEQGILDIVRNFGQEFSDRFITQKYKDQYAEARKHMDEVGMTSGERQSYLGDKGFLGAAAVLGSMFTRREYIAKAGTVWKKALRPGGRWAGKKLIWPFAAAGGILARGGRWMGSLLKRKK